MQPRRSPLPSWDNLAKELDTNGDGVISLAELEKIPPSGFRDDIEPRTAGLARVYGKNELIRVFQKIDDRGRRFQSDRLLDGHNVSMLVFLISLVALGIAAARTVRAAPYATRMHDWRSATLRPDGLVESETGATLGRMDPRSRVPAGKVIVDPAAFGRHRWLPDIALQTLEVAVEVLMRLREDLLQHVGSNFVRMYVQ